MENFNVLTHSPVFEVSALQRSILGNIRQLDLLTLTPPPRPPSSSYESSKSSRKSGRKKGDGSGYIQLHYCEKQTSTGKKSYEQYYYHYELEEGENRVKRSVYVPKSKLDVVQEWERKKVPVIEILRYLGKSV